MSANQDNTGGNTSGYEISGIISNPAEAAAMYNKAVEETGCTCVLAEFILAPDDQGIERSEAGTVSVDAAISSEHNSAESYSCAWMKH